MTWPRFQQEHPTVGPHRIRVELPFEQEVNPFIERMSEHRTFFTRLHHFVLASHAVVVAPVGIGTVRGRR